MTQARPTDNLSLSALEQQLRLSVTQERLRTWMKARPFKVICDLILNWVGIIAALILMGIFNNPVLYVIGALWVGFRQYALFIMGHDGAHWCLNTNHKINDSITRWFILGPLCMALESGRRNHLLHHKTLGTEADPDRYIHSLANKNSPTELLLFCSGLATFAKTVRKVTTVKQPESQNVENEASDLKTFLRQRIPIMVTQPIILALIWACHLPLWSYAFLWIFPIYLNVFVADEIRAFCDHAVPLVPDDSADPHRLVSFEASWIESMIYSPYNMNYHAEHHLWPGVPYYNRHLVYDFLKGHPQVTYRKSYTTFLFSLVAKLPLAGPSSQTEHSDYRESESPA
jgi:fatty acid desaturase